MRKLSLLILAVPLIAIISGCAIPQTVNVNLKDSTYVSTKTEAPANNSKTPENAEAEADSYQQETQADNKPPDNTEAETNSYQQEAPVVNNQTLEDVQYIRTDGYHEDVKYPVVTVIKTKQELNDYYNANKDNYDLKRKQLQYMGQTIGFLDAADKYDDKYFAANMLILVLLEEPSGSNSHEVTSVGITDNVLNIDIKRLIPEIGTCDMAEWHIFIGLSKADDVFEKVNVNLTNVNV